MLRDCVSGKKHDNSLESWYKDTNQGAPQEQVPQWQILRFERCQCYQYYWKKLRDEKLGKGARAHIIGSLSQVQVLLNPNRNSMFAKVEMLVDGLDDDVMMVTRPKMQIVKTSVDTNKIKQQYTPFSTPFNQFKLNVKTEKVYLQEIMQTQRQKENQINMSTIVVKQEQQRTTNQPQNFYDNLTHRRISPISIIISIGGFNTINSLMTYYTSLPIHNLRSQPPQKDQNLRLQQVIKLSKN